MTAWAARAQQALADLEASTTRPLFPAGLTEREIDVLRLVGRGYSDRQISDALFISPRTVNAHLRNMFAKATVNNRTELSVWAAAQGLTRFCPIGLLAQSIRASAHRQTCRGFVRSCDAIYLGTFRDARRSRKRDT